jgi:hypothetical protein
MSCPENHKHHNQDQRSLKTSGKPKLEKENDPKSIPGPGLDFGSFIRSRAAEGFMKSLCS